MPNRKTGRPPRQTFAVARMIQTDWILGQPAGTRLPGMRALAKQYGVSRVTVESAMNRLHTERLVEKKAGRGMYIAKSPMIRWRRFVGKSIGVSMVKPRKNLQESFMLEVVQGFLEVLKETNLNLMFVTQDWFSIGDILPASYFAQPSTAGILLVGQHPSRVFESLKMLNKPMVAVDVDLTSYGIDSFCFENRDAGALLARRLIKLGHRRIAGVFESPDKHESARDPAWDARREGFVSELAKREDVTLFPIYLEQRSGYQEMASAMSSLFAESAPTRPSAAFVPTISHMNRMRDVATAVGLKLPSEFSILGCAGLSEAGFQTVIGFDGKELGMRAARRMLAYVRGDKPRQNKAVCFKVKGHYIAGQTHTRAPG